jgi:hypothetical protein
MEDVIRQLIRDGDAEGAERLLREHPELRDARMSFGRTWLHFAAGRGVLELVRPLFALGIPLNTTDESGECPLSAVARHGIDWGRKRSPVPISSEGPPQCLTRRAGAVAVHLVIANGVLPEGR